MSGDSLELDSDADSVDFDTVLDVCQTPHRRIVLGTLAAEQRPLTLNDLTQLVYKYTRQTPIAEATEDTLTEIRLSLYHSHLPKLASEGFIQYNPEGHLVEPTEKLEEAEPTLTTILDADPALDGPMEL